MRRRRWLGSAAGRRRRSVSELDSEPVADDGTDDYEPVLAGAAGDGAGGSAEPAHGVGAAVSEGRPAGDLEINEKIATTQRAIQAAAEHPAAEASSDVNPVWQQLRQQVANSSGEVSGLSAQRAQVQTELKAAQERLKELEESTAPNAELQRRLAQTQADYTLYSSEAG